MFVVTELHQTEVKMKHHRIPIRHHQVKTIEVVSRIDRIVSWVSWTVCLTVEMVDHGIDPLFTIHQSPPIQHQQVIQVQYSVRKMPVVQLQTLNSRQHQFHPIFLCIRIQTVKTRRIPKQATFVMVPKQLTQPHFHRRMAQPMVHQVNHNHKLGMAHVVHFIGVFRCLAIIMHQTITTRICKMEIIISVQPMRRTNRCGFDSRANRNCIDVIWQILQMKIQHPVHLALIQTVVQLLCRTIMSVHNVINSIQSDIRIIDEFDNMFAVWIWYVFVLTTWIILGRNSQLEINFFDFSSTEFRESTPINCYAVN